MINFTSKYGYVIEEIERQGHSLIRLNNKWVADDEVAVQAIIDTFDPIPNARYDAIQRINRQSQEVMEVIESQYPSFEKHTWPSQKIESERWAANDSADTPTIDAIASARGVERVSLILKTLEKVQAFNLQAATMAGKRQAIEHEIEQSSDIDWICSVNFEV